MNNKSNQTAIEKAIELIDGFLTQLDDIAESNTKQSSVEWLLCQLIDKEYKNPYDMELISIIEQAKEMHRIEILKARQDGLDNGFSNGSWDSQMYYTEEFGGSND